MAERPVFYYDLGSPYAYLAAERVNGVLPVVSRRGSRSSSAASSRRPAARRGRAADGRAQGMAEVERRAAERGLPALRWPDPLPGDMLTAMRAATFAQQSGRAVAFSLAAFRQAFAAGRDLGDPDNVVLAAAACELHPRAVLKGIESRAVKDALRAATEAALERGVTGVPTVAVGERLFWGDDRLEDAAAAAGAAAA